MTASRPCKELRMQALTVTLLLLYGAAVCAKSALSHAGVKSARTQRVHYGVIKENAVEGDEVELDVPLNVRTVNGEEITEAVCGYTVFKSHKELPFRVVMGGEGPGGSPRIVLGPGVSLDYEKVSEYKFEISGQSCETGAAHTERERVIVEVEDVNEFAPRWGQGSYGAEVVEGSPPGTPVLRLSASDDDGEGRVCRYDLLTPNVPFAVDSDGSVRVTGRLDYSVAPLHSLEVVAEDCGGLRSNKVVVSVQVKLLCRPGWTGVPDRIEFAPHAAQHAIVPRAALEMCADEGAQACNLTHVTVSIKLTTEHIGKGCDRDTYSLQSQRRLCGAAVGSVDLLPSPASSGPHGPASPSTLPTDDGHDSDQIFALDGHSTALEVPPATFDPKSLGSTFTISTWMKHDAEEGGRSQGAKDGAKEHILCHSDGDEMSRHHSALFVHNCRLVLLVRREPPAHGSARTPGMDKSFQPAEWRWRLPEVCDARWHHYALSVEFPDVRLYIDGRQFSESKHNPDIVDDSPLRSSHHVHYTKLVVGACWQGSKQRMGQHFKGYLAGLSILTNRTESDSVIQCLNSCQEKLEFSGIEDMDTGMSVSMNNEMTSISISGVTLTSVERLLHRVGYVNTRMFPTPGHRPVTMETHATCSDGRKLPVDPVKTLIMVMEAERPIITLAALRTVTCEGHKVTRGERVFHGLRITAHTATERAEDLSAAAEESSESVEDKRVSNADSDKSESEADKKVSERKDKYRLDSCLIRVAPPMNLAVEHLKYPDNLIHQLGLQVDTSDDGLVLAGADRLASYEEVLAQVQYVNTHPGDVNHRSFLLTCTELNGRFVSNQLDVTIELVHEHHDRPAAPQAAILSDRLHAPQQRAAAGASRGAAGGAHRAPDELLLRKGDSQTVAGIVVVCIVCCGFVALIVVMGVLRIRNTRRHSAGGAGGAGGGAVDDRQEMEWDHSALTITVNPMDLEGLYAPETPSRCDDYESGGEEEEEGIGYHDNDAMSSSGGEEEPEQEQSAEAVAEKARSRELEWDNSTLSF